MSHVLPTIAFYIIEKYFFWPLHDISTRTLSKEQHTDERREQNTLTFSSHRQQQIQTVGGKIGKVEGISKKSV
jgi:hypothetical protein